MMERLGRKGTQQMGGEGRGGNERKK